MRTTALTLALALLVALALLPAEQGRDAHAQGKGKGKGKGGGGNTRCSIDSATSVAFGFYDTDAASAETTTGELRFSCKPNQTLTVQVTISPSAASGSISDRRMRELGGSDELQYNLFQDQRGTIVWGDGIRGGSPALVTGSGNFSVPIFAIAPPGQNVSVGIYLDAVTITILP
jgi:spore coat protein U-like protein